MNVLSLFDGISCGRVALERAGIPVENYYASEIDKNAIAITKHNYPDTVHLGDVTKWDTWNLSKVDLLIGGSPCFVAGTKVITDTGYKSIEDIVVGDFVLTHLGRFRKVLNVGYDIKNTVNIVAQGVHPIEATSNHPFYVREMSRKWDNLNRTSYRAFSEPKWKEVKDFKKGDFFGIPILSTNENTLNITEEEAYIIGRYIADGHTRKDYRSEVGREKDRMWAVILSIGNKKLDNFKNNIKENHYSCYTHTDVVHRVVFSSKRLVNIVEAHCGCGAINKRLSPTLLNLPNNLLQLLIDSYLEGDGSTRNNEVRASTISKDLCISLSLAISKVYKVATSIMYYEREKTCIIEGRTVSQHPCYEISFRKTTMKQSNYKVIDNIVWVPFKSVFPANESVKVYNLEVEEDNTYTANNVIVHNCTGFSFAGKQLNFEDPQSKLFLQYAACLMYYKPKYFLLENVKMKKEFEDIITAIVGTEPTHINSALVSAQSRKRIYWAGVLQEDGTYKSIRISQPEDKGIMLKDIIHETTESNTTNTEEFFKIPNFNVNPSGNGMNGNVVSVGNPKSPTVTTNKGEGSKVSVVLTEYIVPFDKTLLILDKEVARGKIGYFRKDSQANRVYYIHDKAVTLCGEAGGGAAKMGQYLFGCITPDRVEKRQNGQRFNDGTKFYTLTAQDSHGVLIEGYIRKLTPIETERLQTLEDNYTKLGINEKGEEYIVSNSARYKACGNGWTVDVIAHIFKELLHG